MDKLSDFKDFMAQACYGRSRSECLTKGECVKCGGPAIAFDDDLCAREYTISGFCQRCQDEIFKEE